MPVEQKIDPFKPAQPAIPGIERTPEKAKEATLGPTAQGTAAPQRPASSPPVKLIAVAIAGGALLIFILCGLLYVRHMAAKTPPAAPSAVETASPAPIPKPAPVKVAPAEPVGPGPITTTEDLAKPWASKRFEFPDSLTSQLQPALVVHLPGGAYWGFSLREPFGTCELELVTNLKQLRTEYDFPADHPMVGDTCNHTIYDLMQYGAGAAGGLVRGDVVHGSGIRPPMAIEIRVDGNEVIAVRSE